MGTSTLFNRLTGASQSTGNWPGVSVEKKVGYFDLWEFRVELVDLPGSYSLSTGSGEVRVVRAIFRRSPPELVLLMLDARNLDPGLGVTLQMARSRLPLVGCLPSGDLNRSHQYHAAMERSPGDKRT